MFLHTLQVGPFCLSQMQISLYTFYNYGCPHLIPRNLRKFYYLIFFLAAKQFTVLCILTNIRDLFEMFEKFFLVHFSMFFFYISFVTLNIELINLYFILG